MGNQTVAVGQPILGRPRDPNGKVLKYRPRLLRGHGWPLPALRKRILDQSSNQIGFSTRRFIVAKHDPRRQSEERSRHGGPHVLCPAPSAVRLARGELHQLECRVLVKELCPHRFLVGWRQNARRAVSRTRMFEAVLVRMRADSNRFCAVAGSVSSKPSTTIDAPRPRRQADPSCLSTASSSVCPSTSRALSHTGKGAFPSVIRSLIPVRCQVSAVSDLPDPKSPSITTTSPGMTSGTSIRPKCRSRAVSSTSNDCRRTVRRASERCCSTRARSFELKAAPGPACWRSASRTVTFRC
ncbi:hypothetical protein ACFFX0_29385 [Citricoccus parietis]|uniref:Uncharacterized protein n=1 Tax=Citricoccus parietis TaxID=592307 RepID=A0ABV5G7Y1_9MICC